MRLEQALGDRDVLAGRCLVGDEDIVDARAHEAHVVLQDLHAPSARARVQALAQPPEADTAAAGQRLGARGARCVLVCGHRP